MSGSKGGQTSGARVEDFEYPSVDVLENPYPFYEVLRDQEPVHRLPSGEFLITRYEDVLAVVRDTETFSSFLGPYNPQLSGDLGLDVDPSGRFTPWQTPFSDPPEHRLKRALCQELTFPAKLRSFEPLILRHVDELIDSFPKGEVNFTEHFGHQLPARVVNEIFGLVTQPYQMARKENGERKLVGTGVGSRLATEEENIAAKNASRERARYYRQVILDRVDNPQDDFASVMVRNKLERDGEIDLAYMTAELMNFHNAGTGTTSHMLSSTMLLLLQHPQEVDLLRKDPSRAGRVVDEALRLESPVQWLQRIVMKDTEVCGVKIPRESSVLIVWGAANRDPRKFVEPDRFWPDRPGALRDRIQGALAFGSGIHTCVGGPLARLEGKIALNRILERIPDLQLSERNDFLHILEFNHRAPVAVWLKYGDILPGKASDETADAQGACPHAKVAEQA